MDPELWTDAITINIQQSIVDEPIEGKPDHKCQ